MEERSDPDRRADAVASRQFGALALAQARQAGLSVCQIRRRLESGRWLRMARGVVVVAGAPKSWQQSLMVAVLAGPPGTVASHLSAAALFGLWKPQGEVHVTVPKTASGRSPVGIVHHGALGAQDVTVFGTIPCTRPARTLLDSAAVLRLERFCDVLDEALCRPLTDVAALGAAMARAGRAPGRKGTANLVRALEVWTPGRRPGSPAEMRLVRRLQTWGFRLPERQVAVRDRQGRFVARVDLGWTAERVALEYDGVRHHGPRRLASDDHRLECIEACGWKVLRVRAPDLQPGPASFLRDWVAAHLEAPPARRDRGRQSWGGTRTSVRIT
ncbi:MAG: type IV toxin-antitoxin system AbiEi family antitoxin domain-containing protein [Acidimicrobiia bacterium]